MTSRHNARKGFVMPMVLIIMSTLMLIILLVGQAIVSNQRQITQYSYQLIARAAAKAAVDIAKEEIDRNLSYCGTPENKNDPGSDSNSTVLYNSPAYKITYEIQIFDNVCTGTGRNVRAIGRVYIPEISLTAAYLQDIRVRLVQSGLVTDSPADYSPIAWYRSDVASSVRQSATNSYSGTFNFDSRHEEQLDGVVKSGACNFSSNNDLEFHTGNENTGEQRIGLTFDGVSIPKNATITNAYIQFRSRGISGTGGTSAQLSQALTTRIWAYDVDDKSAFSCPGNNQLTASSPLTGSVDWAMPSWPTQNQQSSAQRTPDLTTQIQAIVNRSGWSSGNRIGFRFERVSGSGLRNAATGNGQLQLVVNWQTSGGSAAATNGSTVVQWQDQTSNSNHLDLLSGAPVLRTSVLNGKQVIEFQQSSGVPDILGDLSMTPTVTNSTGMTVIAVMRPTTTGSTSGDDRFVTLLNSASNNDTGSPSSGGAVRAFKRNGVTSGINAQAFNYTPQEITSALGGSFSGGSWGVYAFTIANGYLERFSRNGSPNALFNGTETANFNVDQLLLGGTSTGSGTYGYPGDMQVAEVVVYDKVLSCGQIRLIENYYETSSSWGITSTNYNCPLQ